MLSEGSTVKGSPEDKQPSGPYILCQDFTAGHSGTPHRYQKFHFKLSDYD